jgi:serine/threonine-protein kinase
LFWRPADGTGSDQRLLTRANDLVDLTGTGWSADGRQLLFTEVAAKMVIGQLAIERPSDAHVVLASDFNNSAATVSPDGRWIAYDSNVSGRSEIYVERYPQLGSRQKISTAGGRRPLWSSNGQELFFGSPDVRQMFAVPLQSGPMLVAGQPQMLFEVTMAAIQGGSWPYDVAPDGRFVIIRSGQAEIAGGAGPEIVVVQNWFEELKRLVPVR